MNQVIKYFPLLLVIPIYCPSAEAVEPVKVFIMAGQSNMQGHGRVETGNGNVAGGIGSLRYQVDNDPANYGHLVDTNGNWGTRDDVWVHYTSENSAGNTVIEKGNLTVGFGESDRIGPELGFGNVLGDYYGEQVLLIKTAWGGKSLAVDFRPPSSGGTVGPYYNKMLTSVNNVLDNLATEFPGYSGQGYELVGFGWHQGWNDRVNQGFNDQYEVNMANFIRDVRDDLNAPELPFVIATTGMSGWTETHPRALSLMNAQLAMENETKYPEFVGNVEVVETRGMYRDVNQSPVNQGYHWNGNGETYYLIGQGMGEEMVSMVVPEPSSCVLAVLGAAVFVAVRRQRDSSGH